MSSYQDIYKNLCRVCLNYSDNKNMVSLVEKDSADGLSTIGRAVLIFAKISIERDINFPNLMCKICMTLLKQAACFKLRCESSDKKLKLWNEIYQQTKQSGIKIEEIVVDNIIFSKYFPEETSIVNSSHENCSENNTSNISVCSEAEESEGCESEIFSHSNNDHYTQQDFDNDSSEEILDLMEKSIGQYPTNISNSKSYICRKLVIRKQRHAKLQARQCQLQRIRNAMKIKSLKKKLFAGNTISKEKLYCETCKKKFANLNTYKYHMQRHQGYSFICEHCGKGFPLIGELNQHQITQHGTGPYIPCKLCNFKAPRQHELNEHLRLHTGERPYTCDKCGLTFRRRAIWRKHMIYHTEKTVQCPHCSKKFYREHDMLAHMNNMHERMYLYACHKCNITYAKTATVRRHLTEKHGIPREEQGKIVRINKRR